ncbi:MAG: alpha/beta hydrolase [Thiobacillus sp.]|nr:alpha/beta hydrolase [Thiobacillus sp.]
MMGTCAIKVRQRAAGWVHTAKRRPGEACIAPMAAFVALLLAFTLGGCATVQRDTAIDVPDPGRLLSAQKAVSVAGLRPCNDGASNTLQIDPSQPVNILVHGCNGSTGKFHALAEVLAFHGQQSACLAYNDRDSLMVSSGQLARAVDTLAGYLDAPQITVIGHSMGGLVARKALVADRPEPVRNTQIDLRLVTVSAPFSGIAAARMCAASALRVATLGLNDLVCWLISGDNWYEITSASDFIQKPGSLAAQVSRHLKVVTDERGACRRRSDTGRCIQSDTIFSLAEQRHPPVTRAALTTDVEVVAGHVEIVGESGVTPHKLIDVFQREGIVRATPPERQSAFQALLAQLYGQ